MDIIKQLRYASESDYTLGCFIINNDPFCVVLEDEKRTVKLKGETRIPAGEYFLGIRKEVTPLTQKYLNDSRLKPWFERHIEVLGVPNFIGVYIHIGNDDDDTDGCILIGKRSDINVDEGNNIQQSVITYKEFYQWAYPKLKAGQQIKLIIKDVM